MRELVIGEKMAWEKRVMAARQELLDKAYPSVPLPFMRNNILRILADDTDIDPDGLGQLFEGCLCYSPLRKNDLFGLEGVVQMEIVGLLEFKELWRPYIVHSVTKAGVLWYYETI